MIEVIQMENDFFLGVYSPIFDDSYTRDVLTQQILHFISKIFDISRKGMSEEGIFVAVDHMSSSTTTMFVQYRKSNSMSLFLDFVCQRNKEIRIDSHQGFN
jgi:hypothetical protein